MNSNWLRDMHLFVEVAKTKNFSRAAAALEMPASTLSRRIAGLEANLNLRLLNRTTRRVELTDDGAAYFARANGIVEEARQAHEELRQRNTKPGGLLRISMPANFALRAAPWLLEFSRIYPEVTFEIDVSAIRVDLIAEKYDVVFRIGELPDSGLTIIRRLGAITQSLYAAPEYLRTHGTPAHPRELSGHQCLRVGGVPEQNTWTLTRGVERVTVPIMMRCWLNNGPLLLRLAIEGMGIATIVDVSCEEEFKSGRLIRVLPDWHLPQLPFCAITSTRLLPAKTRALIDFLMEKIGGTYGISAIPASLSSQ
jgi:DNA-binding transcriptional LysR family regulator